MTRGSWRMALDHARTISDLPDEYLSDIGPMLKKVAFATGAEQYNILQVRVNLNLTFALFLIYTNNNANCLSLLLLFEKRKLLKMFRNLSYSITQLNFKGIHFIYRMHILLHKVYALKCGGF